MKNQNNLAIYTILQKKKKRQPKIQKKKKAENKT